MISDRMFQTRGNSVIFNFLFCWIGFILFRCLYKVSEIKTLIFNPVTKHEYRDTH